MDTNYWQECGNYVNIIIHKIKLYIWCCLQNQPVYKTVSLLLLFLQKKLLLVKMLVVFVGLLDWLPFCLSSLVHFHLNFLCSLIHIFHIPYTVYAIKVALAIVGYLLHSIWYFVLKLSLVNMFLPKCNQEKFPARFIKVIWIYLKRMYTTFKVYLHLSCITLPSAGAVISVLLLFLKRFWAPLLWLKN